MIYIILVLLGLCLGSFINALVWRLHQQEKLGARRLKLAKSKNTKLSSFQLITPNYSVLKGRSMCPNCKHQLSAKDLMPIFSWIALKGKCRYCKKPISWQYPVVELSTALLFAVSYLFWPTQMTQNWQYIAFASWIIALTGLIALAVYDIKWMILPDKILKPLFVFMLVAFGLQIVLGRPYQDIWQATLSILIGGGIFWVLYQISDGKWIGGGDVKLGFLLGLVLAKPTFALLYLFIASVLGMFYSLPLIVSKRLKPTSKVPFGPFLIAGAIIVMLFGQNIINWYQSLLLIA